MLGEELMRLNEDQSMTKDNSLIALDISSEGTKSIMRKLSLHDNPDVNKRASGLNKIQEEFKESSVSSSEDGGGHTDVRGEDEEEK